MHVALGVLSVWLAGCRCDDRGVRDGCVLGGCTFGCTVRIDGRNGMEINGINQSMRRNQMLRVVS